MRIYSQTPRAKKARERYHNDSEYREKVNRGHNEKYRNDPEYRKQQIERAKQKYNNDPEFMERAKERARIYQDRKDGKIDYQEQRKAQQRRCRERLKLKVFLFLGNKCAYCGCDDVRAFEINHKNGGGTRENEDLQYNYFRLYHDILDGRRKDLELTCRVCNANHYLRSKGITGITVVWTSPIRGSEIIGTELPGNDLGSAGESLTTKRTLEGVETSIKTTYQERDS